MEWENPCVCVSSVKCVCVYQCQCQVRDMDVERERKMWMGDLYPEESSSSTMHDFVI